MTNKYTKQVQDFLKKTGTKLKIEYFDTDKYFFDDKEVRNIYRCVLKNKRGQYTFKFGDSIYNTENGLEPTEYDILACMQKYDVGTFEDFVLEFGYEIYDTEERKRAKKLYKAVCREYNALCRLFTPEELEELAEIN